VSRKGLALSGTGAFGGMLNLDESESCCLVLGIDRYRVRVTGAILFCNDLTTIATRGLDKSPDSLPDIDQSN